MAREDLVITISAVDKASGVFKGMAATVGQVNKGVQDLSNTARTLNWMFLGQDLVRAARTGATGLLSLVKATSDVAEAQNFVQQVFEDSTQTVLDFAKKSTNATLMSEKQILDAAATFGVFGKSAGLAGEDLAGFSKNLVLLAADMASIKNTSVDQAINAIGAAFRNEHTPIRQYGAALDEASLKAKALALGIYDGTGALSTQQRVIATNQLLYEQLSFAIGDVGRTFNEVANQQRLLGAQFENFKASIGETLTPMFRNIMGAAQGALNVFLGMPEPLKNLALNAAAAGTGFLALSGGILLIASKAQQAVTAFRDMRAGMDQWVASGGKARGAIAGLGKALGGLGLAAAGSGMVFSFINDIRDVAGQAEDAVKKMNVALAEGDKAKAWSGFLDLAKNKDDALTFSHIITDVGKKIQLFGSDTKRPIEDLDAAFKSLLDQNPANAAAVLDIMRQQIEASDQSSSQTKDNINLWNRWNEQLKLNVANMQASGQETGLTAEQLEKYGNAALDAGEATSEMDEGAQKAAEALAEMRSELARVESAFVPLEDRVEGFATAIEESVGSNTFLENVINIKDAVGELVDGLKEEDAEIRKGAEGLDLNTASGRDALKTLDDLAQVIGEDMVRAYKDSGGNIEEARKNMMSWREEVANQMRQAGISEPIIQSYLEQLNLTDGTFESIIKLSGQEEARRKLDELNIEYQKLPPRIYTEVQAAIDRGDYEAAYGIMKDFLESTIETPVETTGAEQAAIGSRDDIENVMRPPVDQEITTSNDDRNQTKGWFTSLFGRSVDQPTTTSNSDRYQTKGWFHSLFSVPVNQDVNTDNNDRGTTRSHINNTFSSPINQRITTSNDDADDTKRSIGGWFQSAINQTVNIVTKRTSTGGGGNAPLPVMTGAARPSAAEYAATSADGVGATMTVPTPVAAGRAAPTATGNIINLTVHMAAGTNEARVVDLLRRYERSNGSGRLAS